METTRRWMEEANSLISDIRSCCVISSGIFPNKEHLKPMNALLKFWRVKVQEYYTQDIGRFVRLAEVENYLDQASKLKVEHDNPQRRTLEDIYVKVTEVRRQVVKHNSSESLSYSEAKFFFSEIMTFGVYFPEANSIREKVYVNFDLETRLSEKLSKEELVKIQQMIQNDRRLVDPELASGIIDVVNEFDRLEEKINDMLRKSHLDFSDTKMIEELDREIKDSRLILPNEEPFKDLYESFCFTVRCSLDFRVKAPTIDHAVANLRSILESKVNENYVELISLLSPIVNIKFSISPVKEYIQLCKVLYWRAQVKDAFANNEISLLSLESTISAAPKNIEKFPDAHKELEIVRQVIERAKGWRKRCTEYFQDVDALFSLTNSKSLSNSIKGLSNTMTSLQTIYNNEDLMFIKNLPKVFDQLNQTEKILLACSHISRVVGGEIIGLDQFTQILYFVNDHIDEDKKHSPLMNQFYNIQKEVVPSLEHLNKVLNAVMENGSNDNRRMQTPRMIIEEQKNKIKVFDIDFHSQKLNGRVDLGELGEKMIIHLEEFFQWEKEARSLMTENKIKSLLKFTTKEELNLLITKVKELKSNLIRSNLYTDVLESFLTYYWSLKAVAVLYVRTAPLAEFQALIQSDVPHNFDSRKLLKIIKSQVEAAKYLMRFEEKINKKIPTLSAVKKLGTIVKGCRVALGIKVKVVKDLLASCKKISKRKRELKLKIKPNVEEIEFMIEFLKKQKIDCSSEISMYEEKINEFSSLLKQVKRKEKITEAIQNYKAMNIFSPEFEAIIRENKVDPATEREFEHLLSGNYSYEALNELEARTETFEDRIWAQGKKEKIFLKKVQIIEEAMNGKNELAITVPNIRTLYREAKSMKSKSEEFLTKLGVVKNLLKSAIGKLKSIKKLDIEELKRIKKRIFKCIDISSEIEAYTKMQEQSDAKANAKSKSKSQGLRKRKPLRETDRRSRSNRLDKNSDRDILQKQKSRLLTKKDRELEKKKNLIDPLYSPGKLEGQSQKLGISQDKNCQQNSPQKNLTKYLVDFSGKEWSQRKNINQEETEPQNHSGVWGIYEGKCRKENSSKISDQIQLVSFESWDTIRTFPQLPLNLRFREKISQEEVSQLVETSVSLPSSKVPQLVLPGVVRAEGISRDIFMKMFSSTDQDLYQVEYTKGTSLVLIPAQIFRNNWLSLFEKRGLGQEMEIDFYFMIFIGEENQERTHMSIKPFPAERLENKENKRSASQVFKNIMQGMNEEKIKPEGKAQRLQTKISTILGSNSIAVNKATEQRAQLGS